MLNALRRADIVPRNAGRQRHRLFQVGAPLLRRIRTGLAGRELFRQREVLDYIRTCISSGLPPTLTEIADHFGFRSPNAAQCHLRSLEAKGAIHVERGKARAIRLGRAA